MKPIVLPTVASMGFGQSAPNDSIGCGVQHGQLMSGERHPAGLYKKQPQRLAECPLRAWPY